jgi:NitT/TauT family transport system ATP-binding protein
MSLEVEHIAKHYGNKIIFDDFSLQFPEHQITTILGPSGCGKTTLLNLLAGHIPADGGDTGSFNHQEISYIYQEPRLLPWKTVLENIEFVLHAGHSNEIAEQIALEYVEMMELTAFSGYYPAKLSGGMKQRVSLARAFAYPSEIILMDEPFNSLDLKLKETLMKAFLDLWKRDNRTVIYVTHDIDEALQMGHRICILSLPPVKVIRVFDLGLPGFDPFAIKREIIDLL